MAFRFLLAGGANAALGFVLFHALLRALSGRPAAAGLAQAVSYGAGVAVGYAVNRRWTFRGAGGRPHARTLPRFLATYLTTLALTSAGMQLGVGRLGLRPSVCWVLVTGAATVVNFVAQRYWVFAPSPSARVPDGGPST